MSIKNFNYYAQYYDLLYDDKAYEKEANYVHQLVQQYCPNAKTILNLGCGTGKHDFFLEQLGYEIVGIDLSPSMIEVANYEKEKRKSNISFELGDVRNFKTDKKFDVVISLFHVASYQTNNADILQMFQTAKRHLITNGIFMFDYWHGAGVLTDPPVLRVKRLENANIKVTRIAEPVIHYNRNIVDVKYEIIITNKLTNEVTTIKETHPMRYFFETEINLIAQDNFKIIKSLAWLSNNEELNNKNWYGLSVLQNA